MRAFRLAAAFLAILASPQLAPPAGAVSSSGFNLSCSAAAAGSDVNCTVTRVTGGKGLYVLLQTSDVTAHAGTDYTAISQLLYFRASAITQTVAIHTAVNPAATGTLTFGVAIAVGNVPVRTIGSIIEPPPPATQTCPDGSVILAAAVCPVPVPTPVPTAAEPVVANDLTGGTPVGDASAAQTASGIATNNWITPPSPDSEGNFRMICGAGQLRYDDPIVYPGQSGKSHLHQFYGNLAADANSTYQSLRTTGGSTCGDPNASFGVNRSGYWMPGMLDGAGNAVKPEYVAIYYKREPASAPECTPGNAAFIGTCVGIPTGLRFITGYNMTAGNMGDAHPFYYCQDSDLGDAKAVNSSLQADMPSVIPLCPIGARLTLNIAGPDCWDGKNLDVADHRSHVAHGSTAFDPTTSTSHYRCDPGHPYHMPQMSLMAFYVVDANFEAGKWHLSSDEMVPGAVAGSTFHADYWEAWSPTVRDTWLQYCTNGHLQCAGGDLGNGTRIDGMTVPNTSALVPLSSL